ncbi:MAG: Hsp70 family protein [Vallitaleaceae bacterium]|nr:Hsp70 family protein [Vallitaleaceae bacterium]
MWGNYKKEIENHGRVDENWLILGIDLGTTHSVVSYFNVGSKRPEPIDISQGFGKIPMPSVVQYREENGFKEWVIGEEAYRSMTLYPKTTIASIKRKMGYLEATQLGEASYLPEEISAMILKELIHHVTTMNPKGVIAGVVVSVPYDFDDAAKKATMKACQLAGLAEGLICLIEEPKAAALAYNFRHELKQSEKVMVFDFGGGTLDITIFEVKEMSSERIHLQVLSEGGEAFHGGDNVDEILLGHFYDLLQKETGLHKEQISIENQTELLQRAREIKERLSGVKKIKVPFTFCIPPFMKEMTREQLEEQIHPFVQKTRQLVLKTLSQAYSGAIGPSDIDLVLLEGGSSSSPWVKEMLISVFNDYEKISTSERPALDISIGATYYAAIKMGLLTHPDLVALGQSIQFEGSVPHDIGFEVDFGAKKEFHTMIARGTPYLLAKKTQVFTLSAESQKETTSLHLKILERIHKEDKIHQCKLIGEVNLTGLPERPMGQTKLKVTILAEEEGGLIRGMVEDLGSMFKASFTPNRNEVTVLHAR